MKKCLLFLFFLLTSVCSWAKFEVDGIYYRFADFYGTSHEVEVTFEGDYLTTRKIKYTGSVVIPETVKLNGETYRVVAIGENAFDDCTELFSVSIPNSVTSIKNSAFDRCVGLQSITIPENVREIGSFAFQESGLTSVEIPNSVTTIGNCAFAFCENLASVSIGSNVKEISGSAFALCKNIVKVQFTSLEHACSIKYSNQCHPAENSNFAVSLYINGEQVKDLVIPDGVRTIGDYTFCNLNLSSVTIPNSVTTIGKSAFKKSSMNSATISEGVKTIGYGAFESCVYLTNITIPQSVTLIDSRSFYCCDALSSVTIPESISNIGRWAFDETPWINKFQDGVVYIGKVVYTYKGDMPKNTKIVLNEGILSVAEYAFSESKGLISVTIPNSVTSIGSYAFSECSSLSTVISQSKEKVNLGMGVFYGIDSTAILSIPPFCENAYEEWFEFFKDYISDLKVDNLYFNLDDDGDGTAWVEEPILDRKPYSGDIVIPSAITYEGVEYPVVGIDDHAFKDATITSVIIPDGMKYIDGEAFYNCENLTSITIPKTVRSISESAFMYCDEVTELFCLVKNPFPICGKGEEGATFSNYFFNNVTLYVPKGTAEVYKETEGWKDFVNIVDGIPTGIYDVAEKVILNSKSVTKSFDLVGRQTTKKQRGISILQMRDGTMRKVIVK